MCNHTLTPSCRSQQELGGSSANQELFLSLATQGASVFHTTWTGSAWKTDGCTRAESMAVRTPVEQNSSLWLKYLFLYSQNGNRYSVLYIIPFSAEIACRF